MHFCSAAYLGPGPRTISELTTGAKKHVTDEKFVEVTSLDMVKVKGLIAFLTEALFTLELLA